MSRPPLLIALLAIPLLFIGCATPPPSGPSLSGTYRLHRDPLNTAYLRLLPDGTFIQEVYFTNPNSRTPPRRLNYLRISGTWKTQSHEVVLQPTSTPKDTVFVPRYRILGRESSPRLQAIYGAGWIGPDDYRRISEDQLPNVKRSP